MNELVDKCICDYTCNCEALSRGRSHSEWTNGRHLWGRIAGPCWGGHQPLARENKVRKPTALPLTRAFWQPGDSRNKSQTPQGELKEGKEWREAPRAKFLSLLPFTPAATCRWLYCCSHCAAGDTEAREGERSAQGYSWGARPWTHILWL